MLHTILSFLVPSGTPLFLSMRWFGVLYLNTHVAEYERWLDRDRDVRGFLKAWCFCDLEEKMICGSVCGRQLVLIAMWG